MFRISSAIPLLLLLVAGCLPSTPSMKTVDRVDLQRFMGDWYVIANIPTFIEKGAHNAVESYRFDEDGTIATTFTFRKGGPDGPVKSYTARGFVRDGESNAVWGMRFIWPFKAEYLIIYLNEDYTQTIIGRSKRDYLWIMARAPEIPDEDYARLVADLANRGYDISKIEKVPQSWTEMRSP